MTTGSFGVVFVAVFFAQAAKRTNVKNRLRRRIGYLPDKSGAHRAVLSGRRKRNARVAGWRGRLG
jgi:hypothetical protein